MIEFNGVDFGFYNHPLLFQNFSVAISQGQTTAILGPSGSGKSTLVRLICGLLSPDAGKILLDKNIHARMGVVRGALFQEDTLIPWMNTLCNAMFPNNNHKNKLVTEKAMQRLTDVGLADSAFKLPHELSSGMKKRLEFVRALMNDDAFLVADEPFSALDFHQRKMLWQLWQRTVCDSNRTAVIVTHDITEAVELGDRIIVISNKLPARITLDVKAEEVNNTAIREKLIIDTLLR